MSVTDIINIMLTATGCIIALMFFYSVFIKK